MAIGLVLEGIKHGKTALALNIPQFTDVLVNSPKTGEKTKRSLFIREAMNYTYRDC